MYSLKHEGNYTLNYLNVEISTRDDSAVGFERFSICSHREQEHRPLKPLVYRLFPLAELKKTRITTFLHNSPIYCAKNSEFSWYEEIFCHISLSPQTKEFVTYRTLWLLKQTVIVDMTHNSEVHNQIRSLCLYRNSPVMHLGRHKKVLHKNVRTKVGRDITCVTITWYNECHASLAILRHSITRSKKEMVTLPLSSLDCGIWKVKHQTRTTITSVCVMDNNLDNMETQQAVDHIPGLDDETSNEAQALNEFLAAHSEPMQGTNEKRYVYDPINDCMQLVGVGKGKPQDSTSTGKLVKHICDLYTTSVRHYTKSTSLISYDSNKQYIFPSLIGTEPTSVATPAPDISLPLASPTPPSTPTTTSTDPSYEPALPFASELPGDETSIEAPVNNNPSPGPSNASREADNHHERQQYATSESETSPSDAFSDEETSNVNSEDPQSSRPLHERIDSRIQLQKDASWKVGGKWRGKVGQIEDPRPKAIIPIHAPKMERMTKAKLHALKQRAANAEAKKKDDMISGIMYEMDKLKEINYSMAPVRADIITESEMTSNKTVVPATNDPNSVRPKPPAAKLTREQKVLPFPQRRLKAFQRKNQDTKESRLSDSSEVCSDASWPTDKDEAIATFTTTKRVVKRKKPAARRVQTKQPRKVATTVKPKKVTKLTIASMLSCLQHPIDADQCRPVQPTDCLGPAKVKVLVKAQQARIRQKTYRARIALKKKDKETNIQLPKTGDSSQDVLAQAINLSNILNNEDNEALDDLLTSQILDSDDNAALDELIQEIAEEEEEARAPNSEHVQPYTSSSTQSSSTNSSSSSSSGSSSSEDSESDSDKDSEVKPRNNKHEITDDVWGTNMRLIRNPFARAAPKKDNPSHQGYFTEQGLQQQKQKLASLKSRAGLNPRSVSIVNLNRADIENYLKKYNTAQHITPITSEHTNDDDNPTMSAKNISKDRSSSRGRSDKPKTDRFGKGREQPNAEEERMDDDQNTGHTGGTGQGEGQGQGDQGKGSNKRSREPPRTGNHDNTTTEDSDEEMPNAKRATPSLREKLTQVYQRKTKETRTKHDEDRTKPSVAFRVDATHAGEKVKKSTVPLLTPTKLADAPTLSLKDLVPEQDDLDLDGQGQPESFKTDRIEFVIVEREVDPEDTGASSKTDRDYEWEIPDRSTFDAVIGEAIDKFTEDDWDRIDYVSFSSVGWNTGVGLFAFGSDKLVQMSMFRDIIRSISKGNKRFESYPKRMLLNRYALTIYFNAAFAYSTAPKLLFFFKKLNGFQGDLTIAETRFYPDNHPTRKGCKIVACEADQRFLDELYKYPKDHPFSIRYGGNLYVRGGERIDPDDPNAVRPSRPKLTRQAAKKFIHGAGEDILNAGQRADDEAAKKAKEDHVKNFVSDAVLFTVIQVFFWHLLCSMVKQCNYVGWSTCKKHCDSSRYYDRASKHKRRFYNGYGTVGRCAIASAVRIIERLKVIKGGNPGRETVKNTNNNYDISCIKLPMTIWNSEMYNDVTNDNITMSIEFRYEKIMMSILIYSWLFRYWYKLLSNRDCDIKTDEECKFEKGEWYKRIERKEIQFNYKSPLISKYDGSVVISEIKTRKRDMIISTTSGTIYKTIEGRSLKINSINKCKKFTSKKGIKDINLKAVCRHFIRQQKQIFMTDNYGIYDLKARKKIYFPRSTEINYSFYETEKGRSLKITHKVSKLRKLPMSKVNGKHTRSPSSVLSLICRKGKGWSPKTKYTEANLPRTVYRLCKSGMRYNDGNILPSKSGAEIRKHGKKAPGNRLKWEC